MNPHVTIRDVAAATGFSVNTVSRALNDKPDVSAETKRVILETARKLGYRPNRLARGLRSNKTQTIGVIVADIANPFFGAVVKEIGETARQEGWSIILASTDEDRAREREAIHVMLAERVDGLLITPCQKDRGNIEKLDSSGLPYVLLGRWFGLGSRSHSWYGDGGGPDGGQPQFKRYCSSRTCSPFPSWPSSGSGFSTATLGWYSTPSPR